MTQPVRPTRRALLQSASAMAVSAAASTCWLSAQAAAQGEPDPAAKTTTPASFRFSLNTSTIREPAKPLNQVVDLAAGAGYQGIEPWVREIQQYQESGGKLEDLRRMIADSGLEVVSAIGFAPWIADDPDRRRQALEQARREMDLVQQIGGSRIAAPPAGGTNQVIPLPVAAERFRRLLEVGDQIGVRPQLELWGFSQTLSRLGELAYVAIETGHPRTLLLPDVYHIYKGGSDFAGLDLLNGSSMEVFHVNDYPAEPPRETINDAARVYPGDGVAPLDQILRTLQAAGFRGYLSLELFNPTYWKENPADVCRTGLEKMREAVARACG